jgi:hypothetical protein
MSFKSEYEQYKDGLKQLRGPIIIGTALGLVTAYLSFSVPTYTTTKKLLDDGVTPQRLEEAIDNHPKLLERLVLQSFKPARTLAYAEHKKKD